MPTCRNTTTANGVPVRCDRRPGHPGNHQFHYPGSRIVLKSWAPKRRPSTAR